MKTGSLINIDVWGEKKRPAIFRSSASGYQTDIGWVLSPCVDLIFVEQIGKVWVTTAHSIVSSLVDVHMDRLTLVDANPVAIQMDLCYVYGASKQIAQQGLKQVVLDRLINGQQFRVVSGSSQLTAEGLSKLIQEVPNA